jgi:hypothetical protein
VNSHKVASREFRSYNPYPQPHHYSPVPFRNKSLIVNNVGNEKHTQGVVKRGGATVKWLSAEQNMAKIESMKRHEEQLHNAEKHRVMQHAQIQYTPTDSSPNARRYQPPTNQPKVISIQGTTFQVASGGSKLVRLSGMQIPNPGALTFAHSNLNRRASFGHGYTKTDQRQWCSLHALQEWQLNPYKGYQARVGQAESPHVKATAFRVSL